MKYICKSLSIIGIFFLFSCNNLSEDAIEVVDFEGMYSKIDLSVDKTYVINFWATWCEPCKEEMPSLDQLQSNEKLNDLKIFPINIGQENLKKSQKFFKDLSIKNLEVYFISSINLPKKLKINSRV